jgi:hypothetical protein
MIVTKGPPALPSADLSGTNMPVAAVSRGLDFAALLADPALLSSSATGNAPGRDSGLYPQHPASFEELALIEPVALDLADGTVGHLPGEVGEEQNPEAAIDAVAIGLLLDPIGAAIAKPAESSPDTALVPPRAGPQYAAPSEGRNSALPAAGPLRVALAQGRETQGAAAPRAAASSARPQAAVDTIAFALGAGVTIHLGADEARPRVAVRGLRLDAADRGEAAGRIARLMRAYGYDVSEQMIDFEGVGQ